MGRSVAIIALIIIVLIGLALVFARMPSTTPSPSATPMPTTPILSTSPSVTGQPTSKTTTENIAIKNFAFNPQSTTVNKNTTVVWTNQDNVPHQIVSDPNGEIFKSEVLSQGQSFSFTFTKSGTFAYHCGIHTYMKGTVNVK